MVLQGVDGGGFQGSRLCLSKEATFYVGEWYLFAGATQEARRRFETALASCPATFIEYHGARGELSKLAAK